MYPHDVARDDRTRRSTSPNTASSRDSHIHIASRGVSEIITRLGDMDAAMTHIVDALQRNTESHPTNPHRPTDPMPPVEPYRQQPGPVEHHAYFEGASDSHSPSISLSARALAGAAAAAAADVAPSSALSALMDANTQLRLQLDDALAISEDKLTAAAAAAALGSPSASSPRSALTQRLPLGAMASSPRYAARASMASSPSRPPAGSSSSPSPTPDLLVHAAEPVLHLEADDDAVSQSPAEVAGTPPDTLPQCEGQHQESTFTIPRGVEKIPTFHSVEKLGLRPHSSGSSGPSDLIGIVGDDQLRDTPSPPARSSVSPQQQPLLPNADTRESEPSSSSPTPQSPPPLCRGVAAAVDPAVLEHSVACGNAALQAIAEKAVSISLAHNTEVLQQMVDDAIGARLSPSRVSICTPTEVPLLDCGVCHTNAVAEKPLASPRYDCGVFREATSFAMPAPKKTTYVDLHRKKHLRAPYISLSRHSNHSSPLSTSPEHVTSEKRSLLLPEIPKVENGDICPDQDHCCDDPGLTSPNLAQIISDHIQASQNNHLKGNRDDTAPRENLLDALRRRFRVQSHRKISNTWTDGLIRSRTPTPPRSPPTTSLVESLRMRFRNCGLLPTVPSGEEFAASCSSDLISEGISATERLRDATPFRIDSDAAAARAIADLSCSTLSPGVALSSPPAPLPAKQTPAAAEYSPPKSKRVGLPRSQTTPRPDPSLKSPQMFRLSDMEAPSPSSVPVRHSSMGHQRTRAALALLDHAATFSDHLPIGGFMENCSRHPRPQQLVSREVDDRDRSCSADSPPRGTSVDPLDAETTRSRSASARIYNRLSDTPADSFFDRELPTRNMSSCLDMARSSDRIRKSSPLRKKQPSAVRTVLRSPIQIHPTQDRSAGRMTHSSSARDPPHGRATLRSSRTDSHVSPESSTTDSGWWQYSEASKVRAGRADRNSEVPATYSEKLDAASDALENAYAEMERLSTAAAAMVTASEFPQRCSVSRCEPGELLTYDLKTVLRPPHGRAALPKVSSSNDLDLAIHGVCLHDDFPALSASLVSTTYAQHSLGTYSVTSESAHAEEERREQGLSGDSQQSPFCPSNYGDNMSVGEEIALSSGAPAAAIASGLRGHASMRTSMVPDPSVPRDSVALHRDTASMRTSMVPDPSVPRDSVALHRDTAVHTAAVPPRHAESVPRAIGKYFPNPLSHAEVMTGATSVLNDLTDRTVDAAALSRSMRPSPPHIQMASDESHGGSQTLTTFTPDSKITSAHSLFGSPFFPATPLVVNLGEPLVPLSAAKCAIEAARVSARAESSRAGSQAGSPARQ